MFENIFKMTVLSSLLLRKITWESLHNELPTIPFFSSFHQTNRRAQNNFCLFMQMCEKDVHWKNFLHSNSQLLSFLVYKKGQLSFVFGWFFFFFCFIQSFLTFENGEQIKRIFIIQFDNKRHKFGKWAVILPSVFKR